MRLTTEQLGDVEHRPAEPNHQPRDAALSAARSGWKIFPIEPGGKRPLVKDWENVATSDEATVTDWFRKWPDANYGIACGPSGVVVVDLDVKRDVDGVANWARLLDGRDHEPGFAPGLEVVTPSGGRHLYWRASGVRNSAGKVAPGVDVRGEGGYVVGPGSLVGGVAYTVVGAS